MTLRISASEPLTVRGHALGLPFHERSFAYATLGKGSGGGVRCGEAARRNMGEGRRHEDRSGSTRTKSVSILVGCLLAAGISVGMVHSGVAGAASLASWGPVTELPFPGGGSLGDVSCTSVGNCTAVGSTSVGPGGEPMAVTESNGRWGSVVAFPAPGGTTGYFIYVKCWSAGNCTAFGAGTLGTFVSNETSGNWGPATSITIAAGYGGSYSISCVSKGNCTAVGDNGSGPFFVRESNGVWSTASHLTGDLHPIYFGSVSCTASTSCTAVGIDGVDQMEATTETNGIWSSIQDVTNSPSSRFVQDLTCTSPGNCTAVGTSDSSTGYPFYATQSNGVWGKAGEVYDGPMPMFYRGVNGFSDIGCASVGNCVAVGQDLQFRAFYAVESNGTWGPATEFSASAGTAIGDVSCVSATECTAVGADGNGQPIYVVFSAWKPAIAGFAPASGPVGTTVVINGADLTGATKVTVHGVTATITKDTATMIKIRVPVRATTGRITVFTPAEKVMTATVFRVT